MNLFGFGSEKASDAEREDPPVVADLRAGWSDAKKKLQPNFHPDFYEVDPKSGKVRRKE